MQAVLDYAVNLFEEAKKESVSKIDINYRSEASAIIFKKKNGDYIERQLDPSFCIRLMAAIYNLMGECADSPCFVVDRKMRAIIKNCLPKDVSVIRVFSKPIEKRFGRGCRMSLYISYKYWKRLVS